ncbi:hypothetical protein E2562_025723 [Oryza meyeriana var. granulata]|uniref:Uncharacterized protein n=1 Tax=Oryza meyeriana var. granulata TaxID=110450 RepID=A0A6G1CSH8_9ORYZ|nr:hypothetical protein E2562_025723 [Oryza meyeriana var. granulata]
MVEIPQICARSPCVGHKGGDHWWARLSSIGEKLPVGPRCQLLGRGKQRPPWRVLVLAWRGKGEASAVTSNIGRRGEGKMTTAEDEKPRWRLTDRGKRRQRTGDGVTMATPTSRGEGEDGDGGQGASCHGKAQGGGGSARHGLKRRLKAA